MTRFFYRYDPKADEMLSADIVIRTWRGDLHWLHFCLAFLKKNWASQSRIFIIANSDCRDPCESWQTPAEFIYIDPWPDTHEFKCYAALLSENLGEADLIFNVDSDTMLLKKSSLEDFLHDGKPTIYYRPQLEMAGYLGIQLYNPILTHWYGKEPTACYMILPPFVFWRSTICGVRELIERKSGKSLRDALYSERPFHWHHYPEHPKRFPDWEMIGMYADLYENGRYYFHDPVRDGGPQRFKPYHSWSQWNPQTQAELDAALSL